MMQIIFISVMAALLLFGFFANQAFSQTIGQNGGTAGDGTKSGGGSNGGTINCPPTCNTNETGAGHNGHNGQNANGNNGGGTGPNDSTSGGQH
ncbi:MAG: hypothetical protein WAM14_23010 [Candidatus Nitrosopolaris sp.]